LAEHDGVHRAVDRGDRACAEADDQHRDGGEDRRLAKHSDGISQIAEDGRQHVASDGEM
jgi:hypothetical protein